MVAAVLVQLTNKNIDKTFDYLIPPSLELSIKVGKRVQVPFGRQVLEGFVLEIKQNSKVENLRYVNRVIDEESILNEELLYLGRWLQKNTLATLISCYQVMLPKALKAKNGVVITKKYNTYLVLIQPFETLEHQKWNLSQAKILAYFKNESKVKKEVLTKISASSVKTLLKKKILQEQVEEVYRYQKSYSRKEKYPLTEDQQKVVSEVLKKKNESQIFLLHGVTGSGKTEVYMELIEEVLKNGKSSIVLVPEISLTPQIVERFQSRFGENIAVLHSRLSDGEKYDEWRKIARGKVKIVIGARSAIFAPLQNIGMIIIDEEHSTTYKQENVPKYHAIDVAKERSKIHHCPLVLGSATPSLESYARTTKQVYHLLELPKRVNQKQLPQVSIIDMSNEIKKGKKLFSELLLTEISKRLEKQEQVMLLLNRRGYASIMMCQNCGHVEKCPNCDIALTYHKSSNILRCHYCGYGTKKQVSCSACKENAMQELGSGTEKVEELLQEQFPTAKVLRMDLDTTSKKGSHEKMITSFEKQEYDILLGTQMIAKGLDFANVTLVGVINADTSLSIPDFRSSEYTFQLLSQVSGRSGRKEKEGQVIIQTFNPDHYAIQYAKNHDYIGFYQQEMKIRKQLKYPPFYYLVYLKVLGKDYQYTQDIANKIGTYLKYQLKESVVLGPSACNVFKVNGIYRFGILMKYKQESMLYHTLKELQDHYKNNSKVKIDIDFNPSHI